VKILLIRFSSIGDIVLSSAAVRCIRQQLPDADIHFVTKAQYAEVIAGIPHIDRVHFFNNDLMDLIHRLRQEKFDYVLDLHQSIRSMLLRYALGVPYSAYHKATFSRLTYVFFTRAARPVRHIALRYIDAAAALGVRDDGQGLDYSPPETPFPADFPFAASPYRVWILGAKFRTKALPAHKIIEAMAGYSGAMVLVGGKDVVEEASQIQQAFPTVYNACGRLRWNESVRLIQDAEIVYANDTGLMHVAAALKKKLHVFYGSSVPEFGFEPYHTDWTNHGVDGLWCRPCSKIGFNQCPLGHFRCMQRQQFQLKSNS